MRSSASASKDLARFAISISHGPRGACSLAVDPNDTGKTTLCEAIVTARNGLAETRGAAGRVRGGAAEGAPLRGGSTFSRAETRSSFDRHLEAGTPESGLV